MAERDAFAACDAVDISEESLATARRLAQEAGYDNVHYRCHDVNTLVIDGDAYDAVFVNSGLHHVHNLEGVYGQVRNGLKAGGWFIINEYVGPSRFQFADRQLEVMYAVLRLLPEQYRRSVRSRREAGGGTDLTLRLAASCRLAYKAMDLAWRGELLAWAADRLAAWLQRRRGQPVYKRRVFRPTPREIVMWDPSEAVRSAEILPLLHEFFEVVEVRPWGGTVFNFLLDDIAANSDPERATDAGLLNLVLNAERELIDCGDLHSDFALVVARKTEP